MNRLFFHKDVFSNSYFNANNFNRAKFAFLVAIFSFSVLAAYMVPNDWAGWLMFGLSFAPFYFVNDFKKNKALFIAAALVILAHNFISILNVYYCTIVGADRDAIRFHNSALLLLANHQYKITFGWSLYVTFLSFFYKICASKFFGQELSVLAFSFSCVLFVKFQKLINFRSYRTFSFFLWALIPSVLFWTSVELRESLHLLFIMSAVYFGVKMKTTQQRKIFNLALMVFFSLGFGVLHKGSLIYFPFLIVLLTVWPYGKIRSNEILWKRFSVYVVIFVLVFIIMVSIYIFSRFNTTAGGLRVVKVIGQNEISAIIKNFRSALENFPGNTNYYVNMDFFNLFTTITTFLSLVLYYMFTPLPWQIHNAATFYVMLYVLLKSCAIVCCIYSIFNIKNITIRRILLLLLVVFISLSALYAFGTVNYGTALRHQILSDWIVFLLGTPVLCLSINKFYKKALCQKF